MDISEMSFPDAFTAGDELVKGIDVMVRGFDRLYSSFLSSFFEFLAFPHTVRRQSTELR